MIHVGSNVYSMYNGSNRVKTQTPLPDDYVECEWVAAKDNCALDTGIHLNTRCSLEVIAKYYNFETTGYKALFGTRRTGTAVSTRYAAIVAEDYNNMTQLRYYLSPSSSLGAATYAHNINRNDRANNWITYGIYTQNQSYRSIRNNGALLFNASASSDTTSFQNTFCLLTIGEDDGPTVNYSHQYIKLCKIWDENNNLIAHFIPVYKKSTQKFGLFDIINKNFISSTTENELIGPSRNHTLPEGYTEVDFVRFTGSQYIDLPEAFNQSDAVEVEWKWNEVATKQQRVFTSTPSNTGMLLYISGVGNMSFNYGAAENWVVLVTGGADCGRNWCKIDGYNKTLTGNIHNTIVEKDLSTYTETTTENHLRIGHHDNDNIWSKMDLYRFKKWENNVLVREFVPCHNSSNVYGFYDIVKNEFVTATVGTLQGGYIKD